MKNLILIVFIIGSLSFLSCKKESLDLQNANSNSTSSNLTKSDSVEYNLSEIEHYLDGELIESLDVLENIGDDLIVIFNSESSNEVLCFSSKTNFKQWALTVPYGSDVVERDAALDFLSDYAENNGVIEYYETYGEIPEHYQFLMDSISDYYGGNKSILYSRLFDNINYGGSVYTVILTMYPTLGNFKNKSESLKTYIAGWGALCDKTWFRGKRFYYLGLPYGYFNDLGSFRNKAESVSLL